MHCELCGKDAELFTAVVEGTQLKVCAPCGRFGKVIRRAEQPALAAKKPMRAESAMVEHIVSDYSQRIKAAREKLSLSQEDFAKHITQKESLVHKMETGHFEPPIDLARKLEKLLRITLVEVRDASPAYVREKETKTEGLTIGDILKLKR